MVIMIIRIIILFTFFVCSDVTCVTYSTGTDAQYKMHNFSDFTGPHLFSVDFCTYVCLGESAIYNLAITAVFPNKLVLAYQWQHPTLPPQASVKMKSWDTEVECKKLSVAVRAYCMHACLAIRHPLSKEASGV